MKLIEKMKEHIISDMCPDDFGLETKKVMCKYDENGKLDIEGCKECWDQTYIPTVIDKKGNIEDEEE